MQRSAIEQALRLAFEHQQAGRLGEAEAIYLSILQSHDDLETLSFLAVLYVQANRLDRTAVVLERVGAVTTDDRNTIGRLAMAYRRVQNWDRSAELYERLIELEPRNANAMVLAASANWQSGRIEKGVHWLERSVRTEPTPERCTDLALALENVGRRADAAAAYRQAIALDDRFVRAVTGLAKLLVTMKQEDQAAEVIGEAVERLPLVSEIHAVHAAILSLRGDSTAARDAYVRAADLIRAAGGAKPDAASLNLLAITAATVLPEIYEDETGIAQWRTRLAESLADLTRREIRFPPDRPPITTLFQLAYHGQNDRELMEAFAALFPTPAVRAFFPEPIRNRKIRVGFVSRNFYQHTIGYLNIGLIEKLRREEFEVIVFGPQMPGEDLNERFVRAADQYFPLPKQLPQARSTIESTACDILFYTDLGMDPFTFALAQTRLAPVQCTTWGHPVTTGMKSMDYFISCALAEEPDAQQHYSEKLILLPRLGVYCERPPAVEEKLNRKALGLPEDANLYGCLQSVWKLHPAFDQILADILGRDPNGQVLLLDPANAGLKQRLRARLQRHLPDVISRIRFLPKMAQNVFLATVRSCDVMLDPIHFGGGKTSYEAFALGIPVVTLPSPYLRGRLTLAMYRTMGIDDCIATSAGDYVDKAIRLATDTAFRDQVRAQIRERSAALFEDVEAVRAVEDFFRRAIIPSPGTPGEG